MQKKDKEKEIEKRNSLRALESSYVNNIMNNLQELVTEREQELANKLIEYKKECTQVKHRKNGEEFETVNLNPILIKSYFFKSINPIASSEPKYNAETLGIIWNLFTEMIERINVEIGDFTPNLTTFCEFAGITSVTFNNYKKSSDENMRIITQKIDDYCFNDNLTLAQTGKLKERTTLYRMKSEQRRTEAEEPHIHKHEFNEAELSAMNDRLNEIFNFNKKKDEIEVNSKEV